MEPSADGGAVTDDAAHERGVHRDSVRLPPLLVVMRRPPA
jgi:hypothetical protein